ncbi:hypothetical protein KCMC57_up56810 [Kitasatospora sp. CMC57]|uniref:EfeO-type cupredoxin-like domain-containing protein n=1 Tax=Kitasatospora sp. CMC57 TaxID=3231513 RepID=A0AB33KD30_9ACTN
MRTLPVLGAALLALPLLTACGSDKPTSSPAPGAAGDRTAITATETSCEVATAGFKTGETVFAISNKGSRVTEVYVYGEHNGTFSHVVSEVENIGPGTSREMTVKLAAGAYELACKPGQTGDGIRTKITVADDTAKASASPSAPASPAASAPAPVTASATPSSDGGYDREVEVEATEYELEFEGMDKFTAKAGERIGFQLENKGTVEHELEVFGPDGKEIGEVSPVKPGRKGEAVIALTQPGTYTLKCGIGSHAGHGMTTTFTVS